jgi:tetratricopeptide (TPR) repeat protein
MWRFLGSPLLLLLALCGATPEVDYEAAIAQKDRGEYAAAASSFWALIMQSYQVTEMFGHYVECYKLQGRLEWAYIDIAKQYIQRHDFDSGLQYLATAEQVNPTEGAIAFTRGLVQSARGSEQAALPNFIKAIELSPSNSEYPFHLGTIFFQYKKQPEALKMFEMAFARDPSLLSSASKHSFNNALYIQLALCMWDGYESKMAKLIDLIGKEVIRYNSSIAVGQGLIPQRRDPFFIHPHMTLSYDIPLQMKLDIAKLNAQEELAEVQVAGEAHNHEWWLNQKRGSAYWHSVRSSCTLGSS